MHRPVLQEHAQQTQGEGHSWGQFCGMAFLMPIFLGQMVFAEPLGLKQRSSRAGG